MGGYSPTGGRVAREFLQQRKRVYDELNETHRAGALEKLIHSALAGAGAVLIAALPIVSAVPTNVGSPDDEATIEEPAEEEPPPEYVKQLLPEHQTLLPSPQYIRQREERIRQRGYLHAAPEAITSDIPADFPAFSLEELVRVSQRVYSLTSKHNWVGLHPDGTFNGQMEKSFVPLDNVLPDGRIGWDGSVEMWVRHTLFMTTGTDYKTGQKTSISITGGNFNAYFDIECLGHRNEKMNHYRALLKIEEENHLTRPIMRVAPYLAPESWPHDDAADNGDPYSYKRNFRLATEREKFFKVIDQWFQDYFAVMGREAGLQHLAVYSVPGEKEPRILTGIWWVNGAETAPKGFLKAISDRIKAKYGFGLYWSTSKAWGGKGNDEVNGLYGGCGDKNWCINNRGNPTFRNGYMNGDVDGPHSFVPRNGGKRLADAMNIILGPLEAAYDTPLPEFPFLEDPNGPTVLLPRPPTITITESWNEISENSTTAPAREDSFEHYPGDGHYTGHDITLENCFDKPCHPVSRKDWWGPTPDTPLQICNDYNTKIYQYSGISPNPSPRIKRHFPPKNP